MPSPRQLLVGVLGLGLTVTGLTLSPAARADVTATIASFPYDQDWSDASLVTTTDDWSGVPGVQGYLGTDLTGGPGADPQTITADGSATPTDVIANNTASSLGGLSNGGVLESQGFQTIAMQGSGSADVPHLVFHLDLTGQSGATFAFDAKDIDDQVADATQQIAVQYRVGTSGAYTNLPDGHIADATGAGATMVTPVSVDLPAETDGAADVFLRVLTADASGSDEWVGIDNIVISTGDEPAGLEAVSPGDKTSTVGTEIPPFAMTATGGTAPYTWSATGLPDGVTINETTGEVSGTPTAACACSVMVTVTDSAGTPATDDVTFAFTVSEPLSVMPIADVQGTGAASPVDGQDVLVEGVVTGVYSDPYDAEPGMANYGGLDGFYLQTAGSGGTTDATPGASDAVFVYTGNDVPAGITVGDSVTVEGTVDEFNTMTEIVSPTVAELATPLADVTALEIAYPTTEVAREAQEGMLLAPTDTFTVTNSFSINQFGEIGLATGDHPLVQPTELHRDDAPELADVKADNDARKVGLDDGTSINYMSTGSAQQDFPLPWLTPTNAVRVGAEATLVAPVILEYRNNVWKFQPTEPVLDQGTDVATFEDTRTQNAQPENVGGDLKLATFNVLNYFPTTGEEWVAAGDGRTCTYFNDRDGNPIGNNRCEPNGPRGAANDVNFQRQQAKIVAAINGLDADIVGLEELENSDKMPGTIGRDDAAAALVDALNAEAGPGTWAHVPSPAEASTPEAIDQQDVIRGGFIYKPATVELVGESDLLLGTTAFENAREPLAQAFKSSGDPDSAAFVVIVNHFKSKGDSNPPATGDNANNPDTGAFNGDRTRQAAALVTFANEFAAARGTDQIFLAGDFNSYTHEDPMRVLYGAGFVAVESDQATDESYSFGGLSGSLDHVLASGPAFEMVTGADIWEINANESVAYQYSRYNYNVTNLYAADQFAASDHNPEIVGLDIPDPATPTITAPDVGTVYGRPVDLPVTVSADGVTPTGDVTVSYGDVVLGTATLDADGSATVTIPARTLRPRRLPYLLTVSYAGDGAVAAGSITVELRVKKGRTGPGL